MPRIFTIQTRVHDPSALAAACRRLGWPVPSPSCGPVNVASPRLTRPEVLPGSYVPTSMLARPRMWTLPLLAVVSGRASRTADPCRDHRVGCPQRRDVPSLTHRSY